MAQPPLQGLEPDATPALCAILDATRGAAEPPIRSEIFGPQRFAQHGRSLGQTHHAVRRSLPAATFFPRLRSNILALREAHQYIGAQASTGYDISPAAEWLLDNFHLIEAQLKEIHDGLPGSYFRSLPVLLDPPLAGLPRVYGVAWAFVAHTDSAFDETLLVQFLSAYQETRELNLSELWALPTTLRVVLVENLRRLAQRVATHKAAREVANLCCDHIASHTLQSLDALLDLLNQCGVGRIFLAQVAQRLQDQRTSVDASYHAWLQQTLPDLAAVQVQQSADQAADNLSVSNIITSLREIGDADWSELIARSSTLMRLLLTASAFAAEHAMTRDQTLHGIELLARRSGHSEVAVAQTLLERMHSAPVGAADAVAGYWLQGAGRPALVRALGLHDHLALARQFVARHLTLPAYLGSLLLGTVGLLLWLLQRQPAGLTEPGLATAGSIGLAALLMALPASEAVVALINRLISESAKPQHLPRLALSGGIPPEHRVMVVIPAMLSDPRAIDALGHRLELHYLANQEPCAQFALLSDWLDADTEQTPNDAALLARAIAQIDRLNALYPFAATDSAPRFILLHRNRLFSQTEQRWIGWERKRGKLESLVASLAGNAAPVFLALGERSRCASATRYIVTLDSDTELPPGRLRELVGVAAHPHNQPVLGADGRSVARGYGILQPRVSTPLPAAKDFTLYHWLFAGQCGIDPYSAASSEVYQDLFGEGTFTGKGLLNVGAMQAVLAGRLPEGQVLSHDLLEGSMARCASVSDISVIEDAPFHADVAASRIHRWTRGDWQLLPFLLQPGRYPLRAINRWKMLDNLRRSLVAPMSLGLLLLALAGGAVTPWSALGLVLAAFTAGPLMGALAGFFPSRDDLAKRHFYRQAIIDLARALCAGFWQVAQLVQFSLLAADAVGRALYRMTWSHRHLLQWTTAAAAQASARIELAALARGHWRAPALGLLLLAGLLALGTPHRLLSITLCLIWSSAALWTWWVSRPRRVQTDAVLALPERLYLEGIARDTWRIFERCVVAEEHYLPPDNLQTVPHDMLAHRTSPTNIGLYLLSTACARAFGWIGTQELLDRCEATLATLATLQRHRGHFLNWYDSQSCTPLLPMYVSTVDSGNLCGHLLALAQACLELAGKPFDPAATQRAITHGRQRLTPVLVHLQHWFAHEPPGYANGAALLRLVALPDPLAECQHNTELFELLLGQATDELAHLLYQQPEPLLPASPEPADQLAWCLSDWLNTLRSALLDAKAVASGAEAATVSRLQALAAACQQYAWQADFGFLYHRKRHLFHIGYRLTEQQLDAGFYDLLASESRLTSLLAIAKGDVPVRHWASLGRLFYAIGADASLRSWSGSMFEYLMPSLVLDEPHGSVLRDACHAALHEQIAFAQAQDVPWGISESAYAGRDHSLAYQYAPQGVPRLALRRMPADELVIAPYATALAAQLAPHLACQNFAVLEALGARARYGFIEALDFSPARQTGTELFTPVGTFMAHHQGMSIVALANVLLEGAAQRWGMANPHLEAVASLLHERAPREMSMLYAPALTPLSRTYQRRRAPGLQRDVWPGSTALAPTHVLSNGRYSVTLRANGAGWSRWGSSGISRWRDDALRDEQGSFFYVRWIDSDHPHGSRLVSLTQHPGAAADAVYQSTFHADRVCFDTELPGLESQITVWVSPEDDIEFRQIELRNLGEHSLEIELISAFEVTLADPRADEEHPAFGNLFISAEWLATHQALLFTRKPRLASEVGLQMAHFLVEHVAQVVGVSIQTDRQRWQGRNRGSAQPLADLDAVAAAPTHNGQLNTGLDPVCVLALQLRIAPRAKLRLTFATAASDNPATLRAVIDKYRQPSHVQRASLMSATLTGIRLRALRISADNFNAVQTLTTALVHSLTRPNADGPPGEAAASAVCDRRLLWRFGISGDRPLLLVAAGVPEGLGLLRSLAQGLRLWSWGGIGCDLVVINAEPTSYQMALQHELDALRTRHLADSAAQPGSACTGFHVLRADELSADETSTLDLLARLRIRADGRPLRHHVQEWSALHEQSFELRHLTSTSAVEMVTQVGRPNRSAPLGTFAAATGEFSFEVATDLRPLRPWINVLANADFGAQISETGAGYTWAVNSRLNQLTAWSNDPVGDTPSEWFLLQNCKTLKTWSLAASAWADARLRYQVVHGQGYSVISHRSGDVAVTARWCVDAKTSVKQVQVRLVNHGHRTLHLRLIGIAEWIMGAHRVDRNTLHTSLFRQRLAAAGESGDNDTLATTPKLTALMCTQRDRAGGFGDGTAFLGLTGPADAAEDWSCDRRELFDARGCLVLPDHFGKQCGDGLDPCAALSVRIDLSAGQSTERVFLLGYAENPLAARQLATLAAAAPAELRLAQVRAAWEDLLGATQVKTPDPLFDAMVNRWLLYQAVACRLWSKAGFYQAGGATGFRDQLQDAMALGWAAPALLRAQIVLCASRQFHEGDVQHWWHAPTGAGVRTHFSDDLLWLACACAHYLRCTGDTSVLEQSVPFIEGPAIGEGAEDAYYVPQVSTRQASVYEHAARTIDRSLCVGSHGLPLMGSGDWNDGMNRVGIGGRGESVWLGWFLCLLVADFAPLARSRGDLVRAQRWEEAAIGLRAALEYQAWDGLWFKRAFFDDGQALGSQANPEARIDLIAQAWSVLSRVASAERQRLALAAVEAQLVDHQAGLIHLLDPPLVHAVPSAGYIQAYPPGVRENGGQYSHAGVWALMAQAQLWVEQPQQRAASDVDGDSAYRYFTYLSPAHRASHPQHGPPYGLEPYVMAGDVYSQPPYVGRGGWSWYTGAAAWLHRAAIESIFGLRQTSQALSFWPCLPSHWPQAELMLVRGALRLRFVLVRASATDALSAAGQRAALPPTAALLLPGALLQWPGLSGEVCFVVPLLDSPPMAGPESVR